MYFVLADAAPERCVDRATTADCESWKKSGFCEQHSSLFYHCKKTCGFCSSSKCYKPLLFSCDISKMENKWPFWWLFHLQVWNWLNLHTWAKMTHASRQFLDDSSDFSNFRFYVNAHMNFDMGAIVTDKSLHYPKYHDAAL